MSIPERLAEHLAIPAIAAPMFLVSGPDLVVEACRSGIAGTFPALNQRSTEGFAAWCEEIEQRLHNADRPAPYGVNLIVHKTNPRVAADLEICVKRKVPIVITSLGAVKDVVQAVHSYGGLVFHDVINRRHAEKAAEAGVDGIIGVAAGSGGHAGALSPFALIPEIRKVFDGTIILSGVMNTGRDIAAARMMGADLAYLGTRFIATKESDGERRPEADAGRGAGGGYRLHAERSAASGPTSCARASPRRVSTPTTCRPHTQGMDMKQRARAPGRTSGRPGRGWARHRRRAGRGRRSAHRLVTRVPRRDRRAWRTIPFARGLRTTVRPRVEA